MTAAMPEKNFAEIEPIIALASHGGISVEDYQARAAGWLGRAAGWLGRAALLLIEKRDRAYQDHIGEENDLTFTQREIDFLIDGIERISRKLAA